MKKLIPSDAKWLAGVLDCEGWIGMCRNYRKGGNAEGWSTFYCGITVGNTNRILITHLLKLTGVGYYSRFDIKDGVRKVRHAWDVRRRQDVRDVLTSVRPYLILKGKQAQLILSLPKEFKHIPLKREKVYWQLRTLNKKGIM